MRLSDKERIVLRIALRNLKEKSPQAGELVDGLLYKVDACASDKERTLAVRRFDDKTPDGSHADAARQVAEFAATLDPADLVSVTTYLDLRDECLTTAVWYWAAAES